MELGVNGRNGSNVVRDAQESFAEQSRVSGGVCFIPRGRSPVLKWPITHVIKGARGFLFSRTFNIGWNLLDIAHRNKHLNMFRMV